MAQRVENQCSVNENAKTLIALCIIRVSYFNDDFQSREEADKASEYLEGLKDIFSKMKIRNKDTASAASPTSEKIL